MRTEGRRKEQERERIDEFYRATKGARKERDDNGTSTHENENLPI